MVFALNTASGSPRPIPDFSPTQPTGAQPTTMVPPAAAPQPATPPAELSPTTTRELPPPPPAGAAGGASKEAFVSDYYALLPGNLDAAWARLGPTARAQAGGYEGFRRFYAEMNKVSIVDGPRSSGPDTVQGVTRFEPGNRAASNEPYSFTVVRGPEGGFQISSFRRA